LAEARKKQVDFYVSTCFSNLSAAALFIKPRTVSPISQLLPYL